MNKLQLELLRLYVPTLPDGEAAHPDAPALVDPAGRTRAMVLSLERPADWAVLGRVWQGVQQDLELPAPAIAVSGTGAYQLWFSLSSPVPAARAAAFLEALRRRYLGEIRIERVGAMPGVTGMAASTPPTVRHAAMVPALQAGGDRWSAFVAPDLAPVFADEPWLDTPPSPEGQAELLSRLRSISLADFDRALAALRPAGPSSTRDDVAAAKEAHDTHGTHTQPGAGPLDPRAFLLDVMNDRSVALALRIEAAKALLLADGAGRAG